MGDMLHFQFSISSKAIDNATYLKQVVMILRPEKHGLYVCLASGQWNGAYKELAAIVNNAALKGQLTQMTKHFSTYF